MLSVKDSLCTIKEVRLGASTGDRGVVVQHRDDIIYFLLVSRAHRSRPYHPPNTIALCARFVYSPTVKLLSIYSLLSLNTRLFWLEGFWSYSQLSEWKRKILKSDLRTFKPMRFKFKMKILHPTHYKLFLNSTKKTFQNNFLKLCCHTNVLNL